MHRFILGSLVSFALLGFLTGCGDKNPEAGATQNSATPAEMANGGAQQTPSGLAPGLADSTNATPVAQTTTQP